MGEWQFVDQQPRKSQYFLEKDCQTKIPTSKNISVKLDFHLISFIFSIVREVIKLKPKARN